VRYLVFSIILVIIVILAFLFIIQHYFIDSPNLNTAEQIFLIILFAVLVAILRGFILHKKNFI